MSEFTTGDGVTLQFRDTGGDGFPLVMLHGWGQTQAMFRHQLEGLPSSRVITVDFRGHGVSDKPHHGYRIARLAQDVDELLDHLGSRRSTPSAGRWASRSGGASSTSTGRVASGGSSPSTNRPRRLRSRGWIRRSRSSRGRSST